MGILPLLVFPDQCHVRCSTLIGSCLAYKYWTSMEVKGSGNHSSLIIYGNNYDCKIFIVQAPCTSGGIQPFDLRIISAVFYHCATIASHFDENSCVLLLMIIFLSY